MLNLGGTFNGYSAKQTISGSNDSGMALTRSILRNSWNTSYATGVVNGRRRITTPFRAVMNSGDYLSRQGYTCGDIQINVDKPGYGGLMGAVINRCDSSGIPPSACNVKWVADSSDYTRFKRETSINRNYNDSKR